MWHPRLGKLGISSKCFPHDRQLAKIACHDQCQVPKKEIRRKKGQKTYNTRDSLVITDATTSLAVANLMYGNKGVLKKQLWSQETGPSDHRNQQCKVTLPHKGQSVPGFKRRLQTASSPYIPYIFRQALFSHRPRYATRRGYERK